MRNQSRSERSVSERIVFFILATARLSMEHLSRRAYSFGSGHTTHCNRCLLITMRPFSISILRFLSCGVSPRRLAPRSWRNGPGCQSTGQSFPTGDLVRRPASWHDLDSFQFRHSSTRAVMPDHPLRFWDCRLSLRERTPFHGAKGDNQSALSCPAHTGKSEP